MAVSAVTDELRSAVVQHRSWARPNLWHAVVFTGVLVAVLGPLLFLLLGSISSARMPSELWTSPLTLANHIKVWSDPSAYAVLVNSIIFAAGSTFFGLIMAVSLAWLVERTDMPGKLWVYATLPLTLAMPGMLQAMAWTLLLSPRIGFINKGLMGAFDLSEAPFNIYSMTGMMFVEGFRTVPTAFLMMAPLLRSMDPALEQAAYMSGASTRSVFRRISLPLLIPGIAAVAIYRFTSALEEFEVAAILGLPANIFVFSTKIYSVLHATSQMPAYGEANALAMLYLAVAVIAVALYGRVLTRAERFAVVSGKAYRSTMQRLGPWRYLAVGLTWFYIAAAVIIPFLVLVYVSLIPFVQQPSRRALSLLTLDNYQGLLQIDGLGNVLWNTFLLTVIVATASVAVSLAISLVVVRSRFRLRRLLDQLSFLPHAIPGMVMGLALTWVYLQVDKLGFSLFGSLSSVMFAFVLGYIAYGTRAMNGAILQIHSELDEAGKMSGASPAQILRRVLLPLLTSAFLGVWLWTAFHVIRSAGKPLILTSGSENEVLAVMIWNMWDQGSIEMVGAVGVILMIALSLSSLLMRKLTIVGDRR
jgi:iron(III) transport system permease protein